MGNVNRVRNITKKTAGSLCPLALGFAAGAKEHNQRKDKNDANGFVQAIHPKVIGAAYPGYGKGRYHQQTAPQKSVF